MRLDKFNNPIFNEFDIFNILYQNKDVELSNLIVDITNELTQFEEITGITFQKPTVDLYSYTNEIFNKALQSNWFMPEEYYNFDIQAYCISKCTTIQEQTRIFEELTEFNNRGMIPLLQWLKYFVDTCLEHNIIWGVGRGSSVASYVLYVLDVHAIDSIKYNLDWQDFLR